MSIEILSPGMLTTVQDLGRNGYQNIGISPSGAMDVFAHRVANMLVGNDENFATLEMTITGAKIKFHRACVIAITGANLSPNIDGVPIENWRRLFVEKGSVLQFKKRRSGCRAYLAISGGIAVEQWLGSFSTYMQVRAGGWNGRKLEKNDVLKIGKQQLPSPVEKVNWKVSPFLCEFYSEKTIRVLKGKQFEQFTKKSWLDFFQTSYIITADSNRIGYRLDGETLTRYNNNNIISEGVNNGTIQVPSDGKPIILMSDRQTIGGYPKIAQVISRDLPKLAQCIPGEKIKFQLVSLREAQKEFLAMEMALRKLKTAIQLKGRSH